jgi:hypothetical protein
MSAEFLRPERVKASFLQIQGPIDCGYIPPLEQSE